MKEEIKMDKYEWEKLKREDYPEYCKRYSEFMYDEGNELNCSCCPKGPESWGCHQQNCWVTAHCHPEYL